MTDVHDAGAGPVKLGPPEHLDPPLRGVIIVEIRSHHVIVLVPKLTHEGCELPLFAWPKDAGFDRFDGVG